MKKHDLLHDQKFIILKFVEKKTTSKSNPNKLHQYVKYYIHVDSASNFNTNNYQEIYSQTRRLRLSKNMENKISLNFNQKGQPICINDCQVSLIFRTTTGIISGLDAIRIFLFILEVAEMLCSIRLVLQR